MLDVNESEPPYGSLHDSHRQRLNLQAKAIDPFPGKPRITYDKNGRFKLVVFSDLHFGEPPEHRCPNRRCRSAIPFSNSLGEAEHLTWGPEQDTNSIRVMKEMISTEKPDVVVINGDLITGDGMRKTSGLKVQAPTNPEPCSNRYIQGEFHRISRYHVGSIDRSQNSVCSDLRKS